MALYLNGPTPAGTVHNVKKANNKTDTIIVHFNLRIYEKFKEKEIITFLRCKAFGGIASTIIKHCSDENVKKNIIIDNFHFDVTKDDNNHDRVSIVIQSFKFVSDRTTTGDAA